MQGVPPYRRNVNTVFQHYALFPHMSVAQNVGYGLRQRGIDKAEEGRRVGGRWSSCGWAATAGAGPGSSPVASSSGLPSRGRSSTGPPYCSSTSPSGPSTEAPPARCRSSSSRIQHEVGITFVYVTHDQEEALTMSDVIVVMNDGRIQQQGSPQALYLRPVNRFVAGFIGSSNFIKGTLAAVDASSERGRVTTAGGLAFGGMITDTASAVRRRPQ